MSGDYIYDEQPECCCAGMEENVKLQQEVVELRAHVERLRDFADGISVATPSELSIDALCLLAGKMANQTPAQSLQAHDMEIAERVREACAKECLKGSTYDSRERDISYRSGYFIEQDIRNLDLSEVIKDA